MCRATLWALPTCWNAAGMATSNICFCQQFECIRTKRRDTFTEDQHVDHPIFFYAATKKSNELMAHVYNHLFRIPVTGLRFFTVYGPWGRPDMALFLFTKIYSKASLSRYLTMARCSAISLISMILLKALCGQCSTCPRQTATGPIKLLRRQLPVRRIRSTISGTIRPLTSSTS